MDELAVICTDLDAAIAWFERLGLRLEMIAPADAPAIAELAGERMRVRIERAGAVSAAVSPPAVVVTHADGDWHRGRAGMAYRDLIPGRFGGQFIASHIRIADGGPVADYVHHHAIHLQLIYCHRGWVRVVYEGQGEPFVMEPGDCVLQPPHIRHRVLESSPGLEVIELSSPAAHPTHRDHAHALPDADAARAHEGQRLVRSLAELAAGSGGLVRGARITSACDLAPARELRFGFVRSGGATLIAGAGEHRLAPASAFALPGGVRGRLTDATADLELLDLVV